MEWKTSRLKRYNRVSRKWGASGQELVEFALVFWLLVLISFGVLDLGRAFHATVVITNAAREGARYGMAHATDPAGAIAAARLEAQSSGIDLTNPATSSIAVSCQNGSCVSGNWFRVTVNYDFRLIWGFVLPNPIIHMSRYAEMLIP